MKKKMFYACFIAIGIICASPVFSAPPSKDVYYLGEKTHATEQKKKKQKAEYSCGMGVSPIQVASFETNPPFGWVDVVSGGSAGVPPKYIGNGFALGVFQEVAKALGFSVRNKGYTSYYSALNALSKGEVDVIVGSYYDPSLKSKGVSFLTPSFFQNAIVAVFMKNKTKPVQHFSDLAGMKGVVRKDEYFYELIYKGLPKNLEITQVNNARDAFEALLTGKADYLLTTPYAAEAEARRFKMDQDIEFGEKALFSPEMFFVFSLNSECRALRSAFTTFLKENKKGKEDEWKKLLVSYIDEWGVRFKNAPGLAEQTEADKQQDASADNNALSGGVSDLNSLTVSDGKKARGRSNSL